MVNEARSHLPAWLMLPVLLLGLGLWLIRPASPPAEQPIRETHVGANETTPKTPATSSRRGDSNSATDPVSSKHRAAPAAWSRVVDEDGLPQLNAVEIAQALAKTGRTGANLLAARRLSGEDSFLAEATNRFAGDPLVQQHMALIHSQTPEQRRHWLEAYKDSSPANALPLYLLAADHFKAGQPEAALRELSEAASRPSLDGHVLEQIQSMEEVLLAASYSPAEAKAAASVNALMPHLAPVKSLAPELVKLQQQYTAANDTASAATLLQLGLGLSRQLEEPQGGRMLIDELVGLAMERILLRDLPQDQPVPSLGLTPAQRLEQIARQREVINERAQLVSTDLQYADEQEAISYFDRVKLNGESAALKWLQARRTP